MPPLLAFGASKHEFPQTLGQLQHHVPWAAVCREPETLCVQTGDCRRECTTIAKLCESILGDHDSDISELLFRQASRSEVANELCNELTGSCSKKPPPFSGPRPDGEDWKEVDPEELKLQRMMAQMESSGMSGDVRRFPLPKNARCHALHPRSFAGRQRSSRAQITCAAWPRTTSPALGLRARSARIGKRTRWLTGSVCAADEPRQRHGQDGRLQGAARGPVRPFV